MPTKIEWTDESWNPVIGCTKVSAGCENCYAERMAVRLAHISHSTEKYSKVIGDDMRGNYFWNGRIFCDESALDKPLHWRKPRRIFVCSMGDLFHPAVPFEFVHQVFDIVCKTPWHTYQILTKRPKCLLEFTRTCAQHNGCGHISSFDGARFHGMVSWPHANLWLGVSVENQKRADERIPILLQIPAAVRFVSVEPMLEEINLGNVRGEPDGNGKGWQGKEGGYPYLNCLTGREYTVLVGNDTNYKLDQVIIGCESGPKRRECKIEWVRDLVKQCKSASVKVFVKQLSINGRVSHNPAEWPEDLRVREYPK